MNKRKWILLLALIVAIAAFFLIRYFVQLRNYQDAVEAISFTNTDAQMLEDGVYQGEYDVDFIYAQVEVVVENGMMKDIRLVEHRNDRGEAAEVLLDTMLLEQRIDVDTIAGATNSSQVIKKAVDNALSRAQE